MYQLITGGLFASEKLIFLLRKLAHADSAPTALTEDAAILTTTRVFPGVIVAVAPAIL